MTKMYGILLAACVGIFLAIQGPMNAYLGKSITPKLSAFNSIALAGLIMFFVNLYGGNFSHYSDITNVNFLYWCGGVLGAGVVFFAILSIPILGAGAATCIFVFCQLTMGVLIDHFGILGVEQSPITLIKILGVAIMLIGAILVVK